VRAAAPERVARAVAQQRRLDLPRRAVKGHTARTVRRQHRAAPSAAVRARTSRLDEPLHFDIQSTGQKSHCVNITL